MTTEAALSEVPSDSLATSVPSAWGFVRDVFSLAKPRLTSLVVITAAGGMWLAQSTSGARTPAEFPFASPLGPPSVHGPQGAGRLWLALLATTLAVGAANALNCYIERDLDRHMARTRVRPLPSGRMSPSTALAIGLVLSLVSVPLLWFGVNPVTGMLGALAIVSYVLVYTPMKTRSSAALVVGAVPGALPPLMGWTAVTGSITAAGLALFAVLFFWQMPHFLAIAIYRQDEYAAAGMKVMTLSRSLRAIQWQILAWTVALVPVTLSLTVLGVAGRAYFACAAVLGAVFIAMSAQGFYAPNPKRWARQLFLYSLVYLTGLFVSLGL